LPEVEVPRVQRLVFESTAAKTKVSCFLYTPEIYDTETERRFPVLYWLHGTGGGAAGIAPLSAFFDRAIREGKLILVPGVGHKPLALLNALGESNWAFYQKAFGGLPMTPAPD
jgi:poly(3-hydroxybutyrate) depolymerase